MSWLIENPEDMAIRINKLEERIDDLEAQMIAVLSSFTPNSPKTSPPGWKGMPY